MSGNFTSRRRGKRGGGGGGSLSFVGSGSRGSSSGGGTANGRGHSSTGLKRDIDRDGDLDMDSTCLSGRTGSPEKRLRVRGHGTTSSQRTLNTHVLQREILRHISSGTSNRSELGSGVTTGKASISGQGTTNKNLKVVKVTGWKDSNLSGSSQSTATATKSVASNVSSVLAFLQRRGIAHLSKKTMGKARPPHVDLSRYWVEDDTIYLSVTSQIMEALLRSNGWVLGGANLKIEQDIPSSGVNIEASKTISSLTGNQSSSNVKSVLQGFLERRYDGERKLLDLSNMSGDDELNRLGLFATATTEAKLFPALMKICDEFTSEPSKRGLILAVSLAGNQLSTVTPVTTLSQTFPALKEIDLSNNKIQSIRALEPWKRRFKSIDGLILRDNPIESICPDYVNIIRDWYPTLRFINGIRVRSDDTAYANLTGKVVLPLPIREANFHDEARIVETFLKSFFQNFDVDRASILREYYDESSKFSLSVNTRALRDPLNTQNHKPVGEWDTYIKYSRNLKHLQSNAARMNRLYVGAADIARIWKSFPATRHPSLLENPEKWLIESQTVSGVPDPNHNSPCGVNGFLVIVHGQVDEVNPRTLNVIKVRSFDRTFILGPGKASMVRVCSDMINLRGYGAYEAWNISTEAGGTSHNASVTLTMHSTTQLAPALPDAPNHSQSLCHDSLPISGAADPHIITDPVSAANEAQLKVQMLEEFTRMSGLRLEVSRQCLEDNAWDFERAGEAFLKLSQSGLLPADAYR